MTSDAPIATLPYADLPTRWGITVDRTPESLRVVIPPVPSIKELPRGLLFGMVTVATLLAMIVVITFNTPGPRRDDPMGLYVNLGIYGGILLIQIVIAWARLSRRLVIELDSSSFKLRRVSRSGRAISERTWPRQQIGGVKYNPSNGKLLVRIIGIDMLDIDVSRKREVTEFVASTLDDALREIAPSQALQPAAWDSLTWVSPPLRNAVARRTLVGITCVMIVGGMVLLASPLAALGIILLIASVAPVGIALGTQKKEDYLFF